MTDLQKKLREKVASDPNFFIRENEEPSVQATRVNRALVNLWPAIVEVVDALEYVSDKRNDRCQDNGCTCVYDTAAIALETLRKVLDEK